MEKIMNDKTIGIMWEQYGKNNSPTTDATSLS